MIAFPFSGGLGLLGFPYVFGSQIRAGSKGFLVLRWLASAAACAVAVVSTSYWLDAFDRL